ncbi:retinitis pigmentosa 1-like 1 protein, partial [Plectropomus leopardus]|uniref:retinitis pigmentosa 1-like 1 protein n=1 Tax=Plectropomus leopardus TaxID=160734 RepID=UPI001C4D2973
MKQKSSNATVEAGTVEKEVLEEDNSEKEKKESAIVNEEKSDAGEALVIETSVLQSGKETVKSNRGNQQKDEDDTGEGITEKEVAEVIGKGGTDEVEGEMESVANYAVIATVPLENKQSEICAEREADIPAGGDAEDSLPPAQVDKAMSFEQEVSVVETRALKCETKSSTATPRHRRTRGGKQGDAQEAENSEEPPVTTRTLRSGRRSASNAQKGKSRRSKKIQEDEPKVEEELKSFDEAVEKTDKEREGKNEEIIETVSEEAASERVESLQPEIDMEEGEAVVAQKQDVVEEQSETIPKTFAEREPEALGEECDESWKAGQAAAADDLVQGETDTPLPIPANDSATLPPSEEEATPSAEEQQLEENAPQLSDLRTMTVVLVDTKTKEEQREETIAQKNVCGSPELEKVTVEEQGYKDQVEIVTEQDTGEGRAEETAKEAEAKSANDDQEPSVTETRTQRNKKQEVKATPRSKVPRRRKKKTELEKEEALEIQKEEPAVQGRALRRGRMSILVAQRCSTKTTCKQLKEGEEAEDGEKSTEVQEREKEEKQQQFTHREKGEGAKEGDAAEQMENIDADIDKEETVTEEAVIQEDAPEEEQVNSTETVGNDNTEASVGQLAEGKTSDDAEEAVTTQDIDEREQPTSASKRVKSAAGEIAQETPLTAKDDKAKCVPQKEEASIIEKAQRSGEKTVRATGSKTTKRRNCQREVTGEKSTEEDKLAVETRVLRKGRRSAAATDRRKSKRARTQCQTEEEGAKETSPAEETGVEEESPEEKEEEIEAEERKDDVKEEKVESAAGGESAVGDAEQVEDALTEEAAVLEEDNRVE